MDRNDLFNENTPGAAGTLPLALRMTPQTLDDLAGQQDILGPGKLLRRTIESDRLTSVIIYGPPGTGKSALARIIAKKTRSHFEETNAVLIGIADIRKIVDAAKKRLQATGTKTLLLLDEIHHFNRTQQDALLPDVERGLITLIGITTENPYFYINPALVSRSLLFEFKALTQEDLKRIARRALDDRERGLGRYAVHLHDDALQHLVDNCGGDARKLLNSLEIGVLSTVAEHDRAIEFTKEVAEESLQKKILLYDKSGDEHYDHVSAFIKSMRGSDPDAALYWMSKMLAAGEDPRFIARRIVIFAAEDVGNADPHALMIAMAALNAVEFVGLPEGKIPLAQAVTYVASAPKSNASYVALARAQEEVEKHPSHAVPNHLKDSHGDAKARGHGAGYKYPHDFPGHFVVQEYWPGTMLFYEPGMEGYESKIRERLDFWRSKARAAQGTETEKRRSSGT